MYLYTYLEQKTSVRLCKLLFIFLKFSINDMMIWKCGCWSFHECSIKTKKQILKVWVFYVSYKFKNNEWYCQTKLVCKCA